jgi:hypothetical protein
MASCLLGDPVRVIGRATVADDDLPDDAFDGGRNEGRKGPRQALLVVRAMCSTTAGIRWRNCRRSRPRCRSSGRAPSSPATTSPDISFDRSINPYRGCEHGCVYCFARPTHAYMGLSPGLDFETEAVRQAGRGAASGKGAVEGRLQPRTIAIGTNTDPYQPIEKTQYRIMREILEVLEARNHPVGIVTKSALVTRDIDILSRMAANAGWPRSRCR